MRLKPLRSSNAFDGSLGRAAATDLISGEGDAQAASTMGISKAAMRREAFTETSPFDEAYAPNKKSAPEPEVVI